MADAKASSLKQVLNFQTNSGHYLNISEKCLIKRGIPVIFFKILIEYKLGADFFNANYLLIHHSLEFY